MTDNRSIFLRFVGDSPSARVLQYLLENRTLDFCLSDLADNAGVGRATLYRIWGDLLALELIKPTRKVGKSQLYAINLKNPRVQKLAELFDMLLLETLDKAARKQRERGVVNPYA